MTTPTKTNSIHRSPLRRGLLLISLAFVCFVLTPASQAVLPAPDGGYPGGNTAEGADALLSLTSGTDNTAIGRQALLFNTDGSDNTATGFLALRGNTHGINNTANGSVALLNNTTGTGNTAVGDEALRDNKTGGANTACGEDALVFNKGNNNTAFGFAALNHITTGDFNIALGDHAGGDLTAGEDNIYIGNPGVAVEDATIRIGRDSQSRTFIAGINGVNEGSPTAVFINTTTGQLGTTPPASSRRFKNEIKPMDKASEAILGLKPVTFHYKSDTKDTPQFGLIAEEVAQVNPDLVVRDENGEIYTVRYEAVNAMLLNEFLKEHKTVQELKKDFQATVAQQRKEIQALTARLEEQASQIQKVSAQLEANKPAPQMVLNR